MSNRFVSFLEHAGKDVEWFLLHALPYAATMGQVAVNTFAPSASLAYQATINGIVTAQQSAQKIRDAGGTMTGPQKLAAVLALVGPLVKQALTDAGKPNADADVQNYINSLVLILDTQPALPAPAQIGGIAASANLAANPA